MIKALRTIGQTIQWIRKHQFEALVIASIACILVLAALRWNATGSWSKDYFYLPSRTPERTTVREPARDSRGETEVRQVLSDYFQRPFPKCRPDFMLNPVTGSQYNLELDCYNESLRLAVEYQGEQHYKFIPFFHKSKEAFYNQKYRDELKRLRCRELGITLIEVPYTEKRRIRDFLERELRSRGFERAPRT